MGKNLILVTLLFCLTSCAAIKRAAEESRIKHCMDLRFNGPQIRPGDTDYSYTHDRYECGIR